MIETTPVSTAVKGVDVKAFNQNGRQYLHFTFNGKFTFESSIAAIKEWKSHCERDPSEEYIHIWDCQNMNGFDKKAKDLWVEQMELLDSQTKRIVLVSDNIFIRGAARLMSNFTKHSLSTYKTLTEMAAQELN